MKKKTTKPQSNVGKKLAAIYMFCGFLFATFIGFIASSDEAGGTGEKIALLILIVTLGPLFGLAGGKLAEKFFGLNEAEDYITTESNKYAKQISAVGIAAALTGIGLSFTGRPFDQLSPSLQIVATVSLFVSAMTIILLSKGVGAILFPASGVDEKIDERERAIRSRALSQSYLILAAFIFFATMLFPQVGSKVFSQDGSIFVFLAVVSLPAWVNSLRM
jgi:hypothetical protein